MDRKTRLSSGIKAVMTVSCIILGGCDKTTSPDAKDDLGLLRVAERFKESGDYASAAAFYKQSVDKDPERVELLLFLAEAEWHTMEICSGHDSYFNLSAKTSDLRRSTETKRKDPPCPGCHRRSAGTVL